MGGSRRPTMSMVGIALILMTAALAGSARAVVDPAAFGMSVTYEARDCRAAKGKVTPVTAGTVELQRGEKGKPVRVTLEEDGTSPERISVPGAGPITGTLILETDRATVARGNSREAERLDLGTEKVSKNGRLTFSVEAASVDPGESGHVNALIWLERAAREAALTAPRPVPAVLAQTLSGSTDYVRGQNIRLWLDEYWEPFAIAHEYGHFLLEKIANYGNDGGEHNAEKSYPKRPTLSWTEGFATAFAAHVARWKGLPPGKMKRNCKVRYDVTTRPAAPALQTTQDRRYAQYNETRVAGATFQLVKWLGGGDKGLKRLLAGLARYKRSGHSVWMARDLRDLFATEFERSAADHVAIDKIFLAQGMSWYRQFSVALDFAKYAASGVVSAIPEISVSLRGPGGFDCRARGGDITIVTPGVQGKLDDGRPVLGIKAASGGLQYSADDDCYLWGGDGTPNELGAPPAVSSSATLPFAYLDGLAHWGDFYELRARYVCRTFPVPPGSPPANCPATAPVNLTVTSRVEDPRNPRTYNDVNLGIGVEKTIVVFSANGKCDVKATASADSDCSF